MTNTPSLAAIAEQLCRIEHKVDLMLRQQAEASPELSLLLLDSQQHICPVCLINPTHSIDTNNGHVVRSCGCATGRIPINPAFAPGTIMNVGNKNVGSE